MHTLGQSLSLVFLVVVAAAMDCRVSQDTNPAIKLVGQHTVILVRHAEKVVDANNKDPGLTPAGEARANRLAQLLAKSGASRLIASEYRRTQATLAPLAQTLSLSIDTRPGRDVDALATELLTASADSVTVVAAHSNTMPKLAAKLGVTLSGLVAATQELDESEFDRVLVITLPPPGAPVRPVLVELRYGG